MQRDLIMFEVRFFHIENDRRTRVAMVPNGFALPDHVDFLVEPPQPEP